MVIFGSEFVPPLSWQNLRHVICFRMRHISRGVAGTVRRILPEASNSKFSTFELKGDFVCLFIFFTIYIYKLAKKASNDWFQELNRWF